MALTPDKSYDIHYKDGKDLRVNVKIIPKTAVASADIADWCKKGWAIKPNRLLNDGTGIPRSIIVHNTVAITVNQKIARTQAEQYTIATYPNCAMGGVVVGYYVDKDNAWQNLDDTEQGWHARDGSTRHTGHKGATYPTMCGNTDGIAVEIIGKDGEDNGARLVAYLMYKHNLKIQDVYTHNYCMWGDDLYGAKRNKNCPLYILDHWQDFLKKVEYYRGILGKPSSNNTVPATNTPEKKTMYYVQIGSFSSKANADTYKKTAVDSGFSGAFLTTYKKYDKIYYRVQIGAFTVKANAEAQKKLAEDKGFQALILTTK